MPSDYQVIRLAIETEIDGYRYFNSAAERAHHERARETWMSLAADEIEHMKILQAQLKDLGKPEADEEDAEQPKDKAVVAPTSTVPDHVNKDDDLAALQVGLEVEARTRDFYASAAEETKSPTMKATYTQLAAMEDGHYSLVDSTYRFLSDPEGWNFDQVRPIQDGA
jgi:rubrerythrin